MLILILSDFEFKNRQYSSGRKSHDINYIFYDYISFVEFVRVNPPTNDKPAFIFQHCSQTIYNLSINGDFGVSKRTGLIHNAVDTKMYDVLLKMKIQQTSTFQVARARKIIIYSCYFNLFNATFLADTVKFMSVTKSSFKAYEILCGANRYMPFLNSDAAFNRFYMLPHFPNTFKDGCSSCSIATAGIGCGGCAPETYFDIES